jgi:hypothetical protein
MRVVDAIGTAFALAVGLAALSVIVAPQSNFGNAATSIGSALANLISAAKK